MQTLSLGDQPLVERAFGQRQPFEQVSPVALDGLLERAGPTVGEQSLEGGHVDFDRGRIERDGVALEAHRGDVRSGERLLDPGQCLTQVAPCLRIGHVAPEQRR